MVVSPLFALIRMQLPIVYTFRRCPYAIRARMTLAYAGIRYEHREVLLRDKPAAMLAASAKGTVPVLCLDRRVLDESLDIMMWALAIRDAEGWLDFAGPKAQDMANLVSANDYRFKPHLDGYKYRQEKLHYRTQAEVFLRDLEQRLNTHRWLCAQRLSYADIAVFPFVRQFINVDAGWFTGAGYPRLLAWYEELSRGTLFNGVMHKYKPWQPGDEPVLAN